MVSYFCKSWLYFIGCNGIKMIFFLLVVVNVQRNMLVGAWRFWSRRRADYTSLGHRFLRCAAYCLSSYERDVFHLRVVLIWSVVSRTFQAAGVTPIQIIYCIVIDLGSAFRNILDLELKWSTLSHSILSTYVNSVWTISHILRVFFFYFKLSANLSFVLVIGTKNIFLFYAKFY